MSNDPTPPAPKGRGLSLFLWLTGGALWLIVGVMFLALYLRGPKSSAPETSEAFAQPNVSTTVISAPANGTPAAGGLVEPTALWSEDGIGEFTLTERSGKKITKKDLLGEPWIIGFVFTRCAGPCPKVTSQMKTLEGQIGDQAKLVTMTVDPDYDTPEILTRYADAFDADENRWLFLTGDKETMYRYIEKHFRMPVQEMQGEDRKPGFEVLHTTNLLLVDSDGVVRGKYNALMPEEMAKLKLDLKKLES